LRRRDVPPCRRGPLGRGGSRVVAGPHRTDLPPRRRRDKPCRQGGVVLRHLGGPRVRGAERHEDEGSEGGRPDCGIPQVDLLGAALGHGTEWRGLRTGGDRLPVSRKPTSLR
jgi:hypothetical protein